MFFGHLKCSKYNLLREPEIIISAKVIDALENLKYIGELRQRWEEIKKLQTGIILEPILPV